MIQSVCRTHAAAQDSEATILASVQNDHAGMFYSEDGVVANNVKGYLWFNLAALNRHEDAAKNKDIISKSLTKKQIAKAQYLSEQCLANSHKDC